DRRCVNRREAMRQMGQQPELLGERQLALHSIPKGRPVNEFPNEESVAIGLEQQAEDASDAWMLDTRGRRNFHPGGVETIRVNGRIIDTTQAQTLKRNLASEFEIIGAAHGAEAAGPEGTPPDKAASGASVYRRW